jgi:hypothetical protein
VVHYSIQSDHIHLIVEAESRERLIRGALGLAIRLARAINRVLGRCGRVWGDRYHFRELAWRQGSRPNIIICYAAPAPLRLPKSFPWQEPAGVGGLPVGNRRSRRPSPI